MPDTSKVLRIGGKVLRVGDKIAFGCKCSCLPKTCSECVTTDPNNPDATQTVTVHFSGVTSCPNAGANLGTYTLTNSKDDPCNFTFNSDEDPDRPGIFRTRIAARRNSQPMYWRIDGITSTATPQSTANFAGYSWALRCCSGEASNYSHFCTPVAGVAAVTSGTGCPTCLQCCPGSDSGGYFLIVTFGGASGGDPRGTTRLFEMGESCTWWGYDIGGRILAEGTAADLKIFATPTAREDEWVATAVNGCPPKTGWAGLAVDGIVPVDIASVDCGWKHAPTSCSTCCGVYEITFPFTEVKNGNTVLVKRKLTGGGDCKWESAEWTVPDTFIPGSGATDHYKLVMKAIDGEQGAKDSEFRPLASYWVVGLKFWLTPGGTEPTGDEFIAQWTAWVSGKPTCPPTDPGAWGWSGPAGRGNPNSGDYAEQLWAITVTNCAGECPTDCTSCCTDLVLTIDYGAGPLSFTLSKTGCGWHRTSVVDGYDIDLTCTDGTWTLFVDSTLAGPCQTTWTAAGGPCPPNTAADWTLGDNTCDGTPVLTSIGCVCPETCTDCPNSLAVTISGGTSVDGSYTFTKESECVWSPVSGLGAGGLACLNGRWLLQVFGLDFCEIDAIAGNGNSGCPTGLDWTITTSGCGGSPAVTVEAA